MAIDWFTVSAQIVNFLILVWLLNRFLYKPILNAIDAREQRISAQLEEATAIKATAEQEHETYQRNIAEIKQKRTELLAEAVQQAESERQRLIEEARSEIARLSEQWQQALASQQHSLQQQLTRRIQQEVIAIARKVLADLATVDLEQQISTVFIQRLQQQSKQLAKQFNAYASSHASNALIRSTFELSEQQRLSIEKSIKSLVQHHIEIQYETSSDLLCGIELLVDSFKIAWSIDDYLYRMESSLNELFQQLPAGEELTSQNTNVPV